MPASLYGPRVITSCCLASATSPIVKWEGPVDPCSGPRWPSTAATRSPFTLTEQR